MANTSETTATITIKGKDQASKVFKQVGKSASAATKQAQQGTRGLIGTLESYRGELATMAAASGAVFGASVMGIKKATRAAGEYEQAQQRLTMVSRKFGVDAALLNQRIQEFSADGLVSFTAAANGFENLLKSGLNLEQTTILMENFKDEAINGKVATMDMNDAVTNLTQGFKSEMSMIMERAGVSENMGKILEKGAQIMGKQVSQLSEAERAEAKYIGALKVGEASRGAAILAADSFTAAQARLSTATEELWRELGFALLPVMQKLVSGATGIIRKVKEWMGGNQKLISTITWVITAGSGLVFAMSTLGLVLPSVAKGFAMVGAAAKTAAGSFMIAVVAAYAAVRALTSLFNWMAPASKGASDSWGEATEAVQETGQATQDTAENFKDMGEAAQGAGGAATDAAAETAKAIQEENEMFQESLTEMVQSHLETIKDLEKNIKEEKENFAATQKDKKKDHKRTMDDMNKDHKRKVEDIKTQLDEERAKGEEKDNARIASLERALSRENEDYDEQKKRREDDYKEEMARDKKEHDTKLQALQAELAKEMEIRNRHAADFAALRDVQIADDITKLKEAHREKLEEIKHNTAAAGAAGAGAAGAMGDAFSGEFADIEAEAAAMLDSINTDFDESFGTGGSILDFIYEFGDSIRRVLDKHLADPLTDFILWAGEGLGNLFFKIYEWARNLGTNIAGVWQSIKDKAVHIFNSLVGFVVHVFNVAVHKVKQVVGRLLNPVIDAANKIPGFNIPKIHYALGGVVERQQGQIGSGADTVPAMLSPGEMVLTKTQQSRLWNMIAQGGAGGQGGKTIEVNFNNVNVRNDNDLDVIIQAVKDTMARDAELVAKGI